MFFNFLKTLLKIINSLPFLTWIILLVIISFYFGWIVGQYAHQGNFSDDLLQQNLVTNDNPNVKDTTAHSLPIIYQTTQGDSLWKIAKSFYGDGNLYLELALANNLINPSLLSIGQEIIVPRIDKGRVIDLENVTQNLYTIKAGDSLWLIAINKLGDAHQWPKIYQLNESRIGLDPNLIIPGTVLMLSVPDQPIF